MRLNTALVLVLAMLPAMASVGVHAADTSQDTPTGEKVALAKRYLELDHARERRTAVSVMALKNLDGPVISCADQSCRKDLSAAIPVAAEAGAKIYIEHAAQLYAKTYTVEQLKALINFYGSDVGQSIVRMRDSTNAEFNSASEYSVHEEWQLLSARFCPMHPKACANFHPGAIPFK